MSDSYCKGHTFDWYFEFLIFAKLSQVPAKLDLDSFIVTIPWNSFKTDFWTTKEAEIGNGTIIQPS